MQYLLLIYENEKDWSALPEEERARSFEEYMAFAGRLHAQGRLLAGEALESVETATTVRVRHGETLATDGPFAETREQLGGFFMVEAEDLDHAVRLATEIPGARLGAIEIRPVMPTPKPQ